MCVLNLVVRPQTMSIFHRMLAMPDHADLCTEGIFDFIPILSMKEFKFSCINSHALLITGTIVTSVFFHHHSLELCIF